MSTYPEDDRGSWPQITQRLIEEYPLTLAEIEEAAGSAWSKLWQTTIGDGTAAVRLVEFDVPSMVVGFLFEKLLARELEARYPDTWRGGRAKREKDLVHLTDGRFSTEIKTSGQLGLSISGNRSYAQEASSEGAVDKPERSGYYITANFHGKSLNLLRVGWIDHSDWKPQTSPTGQAASLLPHVYSDKLVEINGHYRRACSVRLLHGVGEKTAERLSKVGAPTLGELAAYEGDDPEALKLREQARACLGKA